MHELINKPVAETDLVEFVIGDRCEVGAGKVTEVSALGVDDDIADLGADVLLTFGEGVGDGIV